MTAFEFIQEIENAWDKPLSQKQIQIYVGKLSRFSHSQLDELLDKVLEVSKYQPRLADIWDTAQTLGFFGADDRRARTSAIHTWELTSCPRCGGEGRLCVFFDVLYETNEETGTRKQDLKLRRIFKASDGDSILSYKAGRDERPFIFRCSCSAGQAETIPKAWPVWRDSKNYQAESFGRSQQREEVPF